MDLSIKERLFMNHKQSNNALTAILLALGHHAVKLSIQVCGNWRHLKVITCITKTKYLSSFQKSQEIPIQKGGGVVLVRMFPSESAAIFLE